MMTKKKKLFDEESDEEVTLKTENEYAKKYDTWREKEELYKLEQKYGSKALNSDASVASDSEDESDEAPEISEEVEKQFLKTLSLLKTKDPRIYDPNYKFFDERVEKEKEKEPETKKLTFGESDDDEDDGNIFSIEKKADIEDPGGDAQELKDQKSDLKAFLTGSVEHVEDEAELAPLRALWSDPNLNEGEAFLRDYILNKRYLEDGPAAASQLRDDEELEEDEKRVEEQGQFERAYNFRFEEPDQEFLKRFPRTMNHIRPKDTSRAKKRAEVKERKEKEKQRKMEEITRMKALKLKEIKEKIARIKEVTGNEELAFREEDIEGDFDPEEHDRRMKALFDDEYYGDVDEQKPVFPDLDEELEIENWDKYEHEENAPDENEHDGPHCEDEDFNMDADYDPKKARETLLEELTSNMAKKKRNRKKKSKLAELLSEQKPKFVPEVDKTYSQYMEEYYKMDCEDIIGGDLPTRFKYRQVVPNNYGLTVEEILLADDKELTQWVPLKKIVKYRPENVEKSEVHSYTQKAADDRLKKKILPSLFRGVPDEPEIVVPLEKTIKKKKKKKKKQEDVENNEIDNEGSNDIDNNGNNDSVEDSDGHEKQKKERKPKKKRNKEEMQNIEHGDPHVADQTTTSNQDHRAGDLNTKKNKKQKKEISSDSVSETEVPGDEQTNGTGHVDDREDEEKDTDEVTGDTICTEVNTAQSKKKRRKKKKQKQDVLSTVDFTETQIDSEMKSKNNNRKRKLDAEPNEIKKKKNTADRKISHKGKNNTSSDPLSKLSDERLKAYGLNPKKYRSFLKYKKF